eukprot:1737723-Pyramimonas_sp.AAC.1
MRGCELLNAVPPLDRRPSPLVLKCRTWADEEAEVTCHRLDLEVGPRGVGVREDVAHLGDNVLRGERPCRGDDAFLCL